MNFSYSDFEKTLKSLTAAYHAKQPRELDEAWQVGVMDHIKKLRPLKTDANGAVFSNKFMWRFVPATCVLILILSFSLMIGVLEPEYELTKIFLNDPVGYTVIQLWGV
jgi:hypothetical protein